MSRAGMADRIRRINAQIGLEPKAASPSLSSYLCRICGGPCDQLGAVFVTDATKSWGYCSVEHCKEGGDWMR